VNRTFPLPPVGPFARLLPYLVGGLMPLAFVGFLVIQSASTELPWPPLLAALVLMPLTGLAIAAAVHGREVVVHGGRLRVRRWPLPRHFALAALDLAAARVADLQGEPGLRPMVKLFGSRMPGLSSGWFLTRGRKRAYVLSTTGRCYAALPLRDGRLLLLGVEQPEALIEALRDEAGRRR
jgi:hypothetical protein